MDIQVESHGERRIVRVGGKITFEHSSDFQNRLDAVLEEGVREVVIDFRNVPFMDSSGIGEVLRLFRLLRDRNGSLILANPNHKLKSLFTMYRFEKFMKILEDPAVMNAVNSGDISALMANPQFLKLMNNSIVRDIGQKVR